MTLVASSLRFMGYTHSVHPEGVEDVCLWFHNYEGEKLMPVIREPDKIAQMAWRRWDDLPSPLFPAIEQAFAKKLLPV